MSYERILKFIIRKFKSYLPLGKRLKKLLMEKANLLVEKASQAPRNLVIFSKKIVSKNNDFIAKNMKILIVQK